MPDHGHIEWIYYMLQKCEVFVNIGLGTTEDAVSLHQLVCSSNVAAP